MIRCLVLLLPLSYGCRTNCSSLVREVQAGCPEGSSAAVISESGGGGGGEGRYEAGVPIVKGSGQTQGTCEVACILPYGDTGYYYDTFYPYGR